MSIKVKRGDEVVILPDCTCIHLGAVRILEHPRCPEHNAGRKHGGKWRVVGVPEGRAKP